MRKLDYHPASDVFRLLEGDEYKEIRQSIKRHGQQVSIKVLDGKVLDGRNRYRACLDEKIEPWLEHLSKSDIDGMSPLDYVVAMNQHRRHDDPGQRALAAARIKDHYAEEAKQRQKQGPVNLPDPSQAGDARDKAGEAMGVSGKTVDLAEKVLHNAPAEVIAAVESGDVAISDAAKVAELPKAEQRAALKKVKSGKAKTLKAAAEPHERNGKQKADPREWERIKNDVGRLAPRFDKLHEQFPGYKFRQSAHAHVNDLLNVILDWRKATR